MPKLRVAGMVAVACVALVFTWRPAARTAPGTETLTVHEWGTFTALQDDDGAAIGAINSDDEPVPYFVCRAGFFDNRASREQLSPRLTQSKGIPQCHPDVTMRLETPVIYFYPPAGRRDTPLDVRVRFNGGWLTEYYPAATVEAPGLEQTGLAHPPLTSATRGGLTWHGVNLHAPGELTRTDDPVWTAPREVARAATINAAAPEGQTPYYAQPEKFLFYRGVGHLNSPLRVTRAAADRLSLRLDDSAMGAPGAAARAPDLRVPAAWLIEIRPEDGFCAFRPIAGAPDRAGEAFAEIPASFEPGDFSAGRLQELRAAMAAALVADGLFADEAAAMLKAWELSYFKSPGRRLFFVTPHAWTDRVLPLEIDGAAITRVMVGRIELITPAQRERLARIAAGPCPDMGKFAEAYQAAGFTYFQEWNRRVKASNSSARWVTPAPADLKVPMPPVYQAYVELGRFRDALTLREQSLRPTPALAAFIAENQLRSR